MMRRVATLVLVSSALLGVTLQLPVNGTTADTHAVGKDDDTVMRFERHVDDTVQTVAEVKTRQTSIASGSERGRGALLLKDNIAGRSLEVGFYQYGAGIFSDGMLEFFTKGVSILSSGGQPYLGVRDQADAHEIRLTHDGSEGVITTTGGLHPGDITVELPSIDAGSVFRVVASDGSELWQIDQQGRITMNGGSLYVNDAGALVYTAPSGTETVLAGP